MAALWPPPPLAPVVAVAAADAAAGWPGGYGRAAAALARRQLRVAIGLAVGAVGWGVYVTQTGVVESNHVG